MRYINVRYLLTYFMTQSNPILYDNQTSWQFLQGPSCPGRGQKFVVRMLTRNVFVVLTFLFPPKHHVGLPAVHTCQLLSPTNIANKIFLSTKTRRAGSGRRKGEADLYTTLELIGWLSKNVGLLYCKTSATNVTDVFSCRCCTMSPTFFGKCEQGGYIDTLQGNTFSICSYLFTVI